MKILAITQARYGSSRFQGKILKKINDKTLLEIHLERILQSKMITELKVATTTEEHADQIVAVAEKLNVKSYQGSIDDVLKRFYKTALPEKPDYVVRLTSDCPLIDPVEIDKVIDACITKQVDYVSNTLIPTFPDGVDVEVFKFSALEKAYFEATIKSDREHVTPYIWRNSTVKGGELFKSYNVSNEEDYSMYRITVDTDKDFMVIKELIEALGISKSWMDYIEFLNENKDIKSINGEYKRNEGYQKSLSED